MHASIPVHASRALRGLLFAAAVLFSSSALAGPPLVCEPFDIGGARSLSWGGERWNQVDPGYDIRGLVADTTTLLTPAMPVVVRMETLRRAAIYASRDDATALALLRRLQARTGQADADPGLARFDAGYFAEAMRDAMRARRYAMPGVGDAGGPALQAALAKAGGAAQVDAALRLRPRDAAMRFAAALIAVSRQHEARFDANARLARAGAGTDRLLARNLDMISGYRREIP